MERNKLFAKSFMWLAIALLITFATAYTVSLNTTMISNLVKGSSYLILIILEIAVAIFFSARLAKMSKVEAAICLILYSFITGLTFSTIFIAFKLSSIISVFLATGISFIIFAIIGMTTKQDLTKLGALLLVALLSMIVVSIINIFIGSSTLEIIICIAGVLIFIGYIMFDIQKGEYLVNINEEAGPLYLAFQLYLDFINLFIYLLRLFGKSND